MSQTSSSKYQKKKQLCPVKCNTEVELTLDAKPRVQCREISRRNTEFDLEVELEVNPRCTITPKKTTHDECGCITKCEFLVKLDFDCDARVKSNPCRPPTADFEVDVEIDVKPHCKPRDVKYYQHEEKEEEAEEEAGEEAHEEEDYEETEDTEEEEEEEVKKDWYKGDNKDDSFKKCDCPVCQDNEDDKEKKKPFWY